MIKNFLVMYGLVVTFSACNSSNQVPEGVLSEEQMIVIMLDIYVGEGKISQMKKSRDSLELLFAEYERQVFEEYAIDDSTYKQSVKYYYDHPKKLERMYDIVLDSLNLWDQQFDEKEQMEKDKAEAEKDSLKLVDSKVLNDATSDDDESDDEEENE